MVWSSRVVSSKSLAKGGERLCRHTPYLSFLLADCNSPCSPILTLNSPCGFEHQIVPPCWGKSQSHILPPGQWWSSLRYWWKWWPWFVSRWPHGAYPWFPCWGWSSAHGSPRTPSWVGLPARNGRGNHSALQFQPIRARRLARNTCCDHCGGGKPPDRGWVRRFNGVPCGHRGTCRWRWHHPTWNWQCHHAGTSARSRDSNSCACIFPVKLRWWPDRDVWHAWNHTHRSYKALPHCQNRFLLHPPPHHPHGRSCVPSLAFVGAGPPVFSCRSFIRWGCCQYGLRRSRIWIVNCRWWHSWVWCGHEGGYEWVFWESIGWSQCQYRVHVPHPGWWRGTPQRNQYCGPASAKRYH